MKKLLVALLFVVLAAFDTFAVPSVTVFVDEKQELSATVWILAGCEEYDRCIYEPYYDDIQKYFKAYKEHPLMDFIRRMRDAPDSVYVVSYNSVPCAAELLYIEGGRVKIKEGLDVEKYFRNNDPRWTKENFLRYAALLDDFYVKSDYHAFFERHSELYSLYVESMQAGLAQILKEDWFEDVYGYSLPYVAVCVSLAYGVNNYAGIDAMTQTELGYDNVGYYPIIGMSLAPERTSVYTKARVLIHEISHSFTNPLLGDYNEELSRIGETIYPHMEWEFYRSGYDADALCGEFFNSLMTNFYLKDILPSLLDEAVTNDQLHGFVWMEEALDFMGRFSDNRDEYITVKDFMPVFVTYMRSVGDRIDSIARRPLIKETIPAIGSTVDAATKEIRIIFSEPVETGASGTTRATIECETIYPKTQARYDRLAKKVGRYGELEYYENDTTFVINIGARLKSGKRYGVGLVEEFFLNPDNQFVRMGHGIFDIWFYVE